MTEQDLYELPKGVRERFQAIPDGQFDEVPEVVELRGQLAGLESQQKLSAHASHNLRLQIEELEQRRASCGLEIKRLHANRPRQIADALLAGNDLDEDWATLQRIGRLQHFIDGVALAQPELNLRFDRNHSNTVYLVSQIDGTAEALRSLLDRLKLAEAERQTFS